MAGSEIGKKMLAIMQDVNYIQKKGFNQTQRYSFAQEADFALAVRERLIEHGVAFVPYLESVEIKEVTTGKGTVMQIVTVAMSFTFIDVDSGESVVVRMGGQGSDTLDKGVFKAQTGAEKYALKQAFLVPTGDDPEVDNTAERNNDMPMAQAPEPEPENSGFVPAEQWVSLSKIAIRAKEHVGLQKFGYASHKDIIADALEKNGYERTTRGSTVKGEDFGKIAAFVQNRTAAITEGGEASG